MTDVELPPRKSAGASRVDQELVTALRDMLDDNETITVRALVRRMGTVGHASTVTRDPWRMARVADWQAEQARIRKQIERSDKTSRANLATQLELHRTRVAELEAEHNLMRGAVLALVQAVGEMGGMRAWHRFFEGHVEAMAQLRSMGALPSAEIAQLPSTSSKTGKR